MQEGKPISWQRTLWTMAAVQAIMMMAFSSMGPFLALFIGQLGVKSEHAVEVWAGVVASANFLMSAIMSPIWGGGADKRRKDVMVMPHAVSIGSSTWLNGLSPTVLGTCVNPMFEGA